MNDLINIEEKLYRLEINLQTHTEEEVLRDLSMENKIEDLEKKIDTLTIKVDELTAMWLQAKGILSFIKWVVGISGAVLGVITYFKR